MNFTNRRGRGLGDLGHQPLQFQLCILYPFHSIARAEAHAHGRQMCPAEDSSDASQLAQSIFAETLKSQTFCFFYVEI